MPADKTERTNMCFFAGIAKNPKHEAERSFFLLDVGLENNKWVPVSVYKNDGLLKQVVRIQDGDFVQLKAMLKPWSKKENGSWAYGLTVEITEIKRHIPSKPKTNENRNQAAAEDIPW